MSLFVCECVCESEWVSERERERERERNVFDLVEVERCGYDAEMLYKLVLEVLLTQPVLNLYKTMWLRQMYIDVAIVAIMGSFKTWAKWNHPLSFVDIYMFAI